MNRLSLIGVFAIISVAILVHSVECGPGIAENSRQPENLCICTFDYTPVCGNDGQTYGNACSLNCKAKDPEGMKNGLAQAYKGECNKQKN